MGTIRLVAVYLLRAARTLYLEVRMLAPRDRCDGHAGSRANGVELIGRLQNAGYCASSPVQSKGRRRMKIIVGRFRAAPVMTAVLETREANSKLHRWHWVLKTSRTARNCSIKPLPTRRPLRNGDRRAQEGLQSCHCWRRYIRPLPCHHAPAI